MSLEAELAPLAEDALTQKIIGEFVGSLANLDDEVLKKLTADLELLRAKIVVGAPDRGGAGDIHINRVRVVQALKELVNSLRAIPFRSR
jgi:hypothetical protein